MNKKKLDKYKYQTKYAKENQTSITFKFNNEKDKEIIEFFKAQPSKLETLRSIMNEHLKIKEE